MNVPESHQEKLQKAFPLAALQPLPDGSTLVKVPALVLPPGWSRNNVNVWFLTPVGYPIARPDCFWTDSDLRLANDSQPKNSALQTPPFLGEPKLWFSWHASSWNPNQDNLLTYMLIIRNRLDRIE